MPDPRPQGPASRHRRRAPRDYRCSGKRGSRCQSDRVADRCDRGAQMATRVTVGRRSNRGGWSAGGDDGPGIRTRPFRAECFRAHPGHFHSSAPTRRHGGDAPFPGPLGISCGVTRRAAGRLRGSDRGRRYADLRSPRRLPDRASGRRNRGRDLPRLGAGRPPNRLPTIRQAEAGIFRRRSRPGHHRCRRHPECGGVGAGRYVAVTPRVPRAAVAGVERRRPGE